MHHMIKSILRVSGKEVINDGFGLLPPAQRGEAVLAAAL